LAASDEGRPEELVYRPDLLSPDEERALLDELERLEFHETARWLASER
jgi:hypothetical protein